VREHSSINGILAGLHGIVGETITIHPAHDPGAESERIYDISQIDFEQLRKEFARAGTKHTLVQALDAQVERKLARMLAQNPTRLDLYTRYQAIIADYNQETDRVTIEQTFADLLSIIESMSVEERRTVREGLVEEEHLAVYDLLCRRKDDLSPQARTRVKAVANDC
jgi:type I restriction enzyme R subunit